MRIRDELPPVPPLVPNSGLLIWIRNISRAENRRIEEAVDLWGERQFWPQLSPDETFHVQQRLSAAIQLCSMLRQEPAFGRKTYWEVFHYLLVDQWRLNAEGYALLIAGS